MGWGVSGGNVYCPVGGVCQFDCEDICAKVAASGLSKHLESVEAFQEYLEHNFGKTQLRMDDYCGFHSTARSTCLKGQQTQCVFGPTILRYFVYDHLPEHLQEASKPFADLAWRIVDTTPRNAEQSVALRKLLESKDAAVRASL